MYKQYLKTLHQIKNVSILTPKVEICTKNVSPQNLNPDEPEAFFYPDSLLDGALHDEYPFIIVGLSPLWVDNRIGRWAWGLFCCESATNTQVWIGYNNRLQKDI